jgi:hypothetical protein
MSRALASSKKKTDVSVKTTHKIWKKGSRKDDSQVPKNQVS